jgi:benzoyl-CoA reductase subunit B
MLMSVEGISQENLRHKNRQSSKLQSSIDGIAYQKEWFKSVKMRINRGEPYVLAQADTPHEIFLTMDIPVVPVQWWSAIIAAKQLSPYYFDLMNEHGYQRNLCRYCSLPLACTMAHDPDSAPWGGLPKPTLLLAELTCDSHAKIFELWAGEYDCDFFPLEYTAPTRQYGDWWKNIRSNWFEIIEPHRLDFRTEELKSLIRLLETKTGRAFNRTRFLQIMGHVNEQEEYFKKVRDLIAATIPCPVSVPDQMASTMNPQWHRGTEWGVEQAKLFYDEVKARVDKGEAAYKDEKLRLMWIGAGLWHNTSFYRYFEEKFGAVFVCSIYLSIAADGYARDFNDSPLKALASRHLDMGDYLRQSEWLLKEARLHGVSGAVMIISRSCIRDIGRKFTQIAFEQAGIPMLPIYADVVDAREWEDEKIKNLVSDFIESRVVKNDNVKQSKTK